VPLQSVYAGTKNAVRTISEGLRQEAGDKLRVTIISPGFVHTDFAESMTNPEVKAQIVGIRDKMATPPDAIARAIAFAIEQPANVDVNEIVIRPTAQWVTPSARSGSRLESCRPVMRPRETTLKRPSGVGLPARAAFMVDCS
jgi:short-subunit dehydrogenase